MPVPAKKPRLLTVTHVSRLTPSMQRVVMTGDELDDFPEISPGAYVKLMFDFDNQPAVAVPDTLNDVQLRTYTVRRFERESLTLTLDMALHGHSSESGPASHWAEQAQPGDQILVGGPGTTKGIADPDSFIIMAGDITALPAISSHLELLPDSATGKVVISIPHKDDRQTLMKPDGIEIIWHAEADTVSTLSDTVGQIILPDSPVCAWAACEFSDMRQLRKLFRQQWNLAHESIYISSYWRQGRSEDQHKVDKRNDQLAWEQTENINPA